MKNANRRPIYWNLVIFALIGALFSLFAMGFVSENDRTGIALLFLGLIGGYAASIKELDLAKIELERLRLQHTVDHAQSQPEEHEGDEKDHHSATRHGRKSSTTKEGQK